jgi:hypothetical protein
MLELHLAATGATDPCISIRYWQLGTMLPNANSTHGMDATYYTHNC